MYETTAAQQRPARPTPPVGQADSSTQQSQSAQPTQGVIIADSTTTSAKLAEPTTPVDLANSPGSNSSSTSGVRVLRTFVPQRPEIGTWKTNEKKNQGEFVKKQCTFDRLMAKYKQQKADFQNRPFKKRESTPPKREEDKIKQLAVVQPTAPFQRVVPRVSRWGPPIPPPVTPQWGPYGVWVPYPPAAPVHSQQRWGDPTGSIPRPSVFSRLNNCQSSSSGTSQDCVITSRTLTP